MNGAVLLGVGVVVFGAAYLVYGRYLTRLFGVEESRITPAHTRADGVDYVPTKLPILMGHHFASIAGAGPIVGPVMAAYFGWVPVVLWILVGCVFVGAMHDFAALFVSVRADGRSVGYVIEKQVGYAGRQAFLLFSWAALILVVAVFALLVAKAFVKTPSVATASILFMGTAPAFGWLVYRRNVPLWLCSLVFVPLMFAFIWVGVALPLDLAKMLGLSPDMARIVWVAILMSYGFIASTIPVWVLLQPRDYLNSYFLYAMLVLGVASIFVARPTFALPAFSGFLALSPGAAAGAPRDPLFPILFVVVACGACSGFHALVASGTTAKQLGGERHILPVGYGSMLIEGVLALVALISVGVLTPTEFAAGLKDKDAVGMFASGLAGFATRLGLPLEIGETFVALAISAFVLTTLDTATRLSRYAWEDLLLPAEGRRTGQAGWLRRAVSNRYVATLVAVVLAEYLALSGRGSVIWPVFGASNQLLAALTLLAVTLYLFRRGINGWISAVPMGLMMAICVTALLLLLRKNWVAGNWPMVGSTVFLLAMAVLLVALAVASFRRHRRGPAAGSGDA